MTLVTPATGTWTVPAGVTSIDVLIIGSGADNQNAGNISSMIKQGGSPTVIATNQVAKAGNAGVNPGLGGSVSGGTFNYGGGQGAVNNGGSYGGGGGGGAGSGGGGGTGTTGDSGGQVGGAGGGGGASGNGFSITGGTGGQGFPTSKGGAATGAGSAYGGGGGGGASGYGGGGGGSGVVLGYAVTPGDVYNIVVGAAPTAYAGVGLVAIQYTAAGSGGTPDIILPPRLAPISPFDIGA